MMAEVIPYTLVVSLALSIAGLCLDRAASHLNVPRRGVWMAIVFTSVLLPLASIGMTRPTQMPMAVADIRQAREFGTPTHRGLLSRMVNRPLAETTPAARPRWVHAIDSDRLWLCLWAAASAILLLRMIVARTLLWRTSLHWRHRVVQGQRVLISKSSGPALLGVVAPSIVVPHWFLDETSYVQSLILQHEQQHVAARDPLLLWTARLIVSLVPWNLPLWWQMHRLRFAIELDCDARVLRGGAPRAHYAEVLLAVSTRPAQHVAGVIAMRAPISALEKRLDNLAPQARSHARLKSLGALAVAMLGVGGTFALDPPAVRNAVAAAAVTRIGMTVPADRLVAATGHSVIAAASTPIAAQVPGAGRTNALVRLPPPPALPLDRPREQAERAMLERYPELLTAVGRSGTYAVAIALRADGSLHRSDLRFSRPDEIVADQAAQRAILPEDVTGQSGTDLFARGSSAGGLTLPHDVLLTWVKLAPGQDGLPLSAVERSAHARSAARQATQLALVERYHPDVFTETGDVAEKVWFMLSRHGDVLRTGRNRNPDAVLTPNLKGQVVVTTVRNSSGKIAEAIFFWPATGPVSATGL